MSKELEVAIDAARAGGEVAAGYFSQGTEMRYKGKADLVSDADLEAEKRIAEVIRASFPGHAILAEEQEKASADSEHLWIVDPLDGTNNFAHRIPHFACSVAYYHEGSAVCGVVYNPITGDCFTATAGQGAYHNGEEISVSPVDTLSKALVGIGFYYDRGQMMLDTLESVRKLFGEDIHGVRRFGTASLDLCFTACGRFDAYFEYELSPWDFAAGALIVREAGGKVSDCDGKALAIGKTSMLASNATLHGQMLARVRRSSK